MKSVVAATLAWWVSHDVVHATSPAFAPFSAVLTMHVTISRSIWQTLRYVAAVALGVAVQAAIGFSAGPDLFAFLLVAVVALTIGQVRTLGEQGPQVATAAFFAFSVYSQSTSNADRIKELSQIVLLVLIGCGIGLIVNLCVAPPLRYRSAEQGLHALAAEMETLLDDMADGLAHSDVSEERAERWRVAGERTQTAVGQARAGLSTAENSLPFNPRRLLPAHRDLSFTRYREVLAAMERAAYQLASLTRSLARWREAEETYTYTPVLKAYGAFTARLRDLAHVIAELDSDTLGKQAEQMNEVAGRAQEALQDVLGAAAEHGLPLADANRPYGVLVVEATRLMEEFQHTCDVLRDTADA
ncbi:aromatic acid exporter family protein [Streptomyces sp. NPDC046939]|uniref:FUSC family protein n=1 Tax=Streptomyces sp. NPDC046939 TaxID=3155376 RepID=UPI00340B2BCB